MKKKKSQWRSQCPISCGLDILGDKWSLLIIRDLMFRDKHSYGDFLMSEEKISTNILADRLKSLECMGIITKSVDTENRSKFNYRLTEAGVELLPLMLEYIVWSTKHIPHTGTPKEFMKRLKNDREELVKSIRANLLNEND